MRSRSLDASRGQAPESILPFGVPDDQQASPPRRRRRAARAEAPAGRAGAELVHRLGSDALASLGFPAGTLMVVDTGRTPRRGDIVFVRSRGRLRVGVLDVELGRPALRADQGTLWIDNTSEVWGVATAADPPLDGIAW